MKKIVALLLAAVMVLSLAACGAATTAAPEEAAPAAEAPAKEEAAPATEAAKEEAAAPAEEAAPAEDGKKTIGVVCYVTSAPYFSSGKDACVAYGESLGYDVIWTGTAEADTAGLISCVENLINQGVDGICLAAGDTTSMSPVVKQAQDAGIPVVSFDLDIEQRNAYAGLCDLALLSAPQLQSLVDTIGEEGDVAIITGSLTNELLKQRIDNQIAESKEKYPNINYVTVEGTDETTEGYYNTAMNILTAYPSVKAIVSNTSVGLGPIAAAIEDAGLIGQVYGCGQTTPNLAKDGFASGAITHAYLWDVGTWQKFAVAVCDYFIQNGMDAEPEVGNLGWADFPEAEYAGDTNWYFGAAQAYDADNINDFDF